MSDTEAKTPDSVTITAERHLKLLQAEWKLTALERGGVDNWDWYGESITNYEEEVPEPVQTI